MSAPAYLSKDRHGGYLFRIAIPKALREVFQNKHSIRQSLQTYHRPTALKRARYLAIEAEELFSMALKKYQHEKFKTQLTMRSAKLKQSLLEENLSEELKAELVDAGGDVSPELQQFMDQYAVQEGRLAEAARKAELLDQKIVIAKRVERKQQLAALVSEVASDYSYEPGAPEALPVKPAMNAGPLVVEALDLFIEAKRLEGVQLADPGKGPKGSRWGGYTAVLKLFLAIIGNKSVSTIELSDLNRYKQIVPQFPSNKSSRASHLLEYDYGKLEFVTPVDEIVRLAAERNLPLLSRKTVADYYTPIVTFIGWASEENEFLSTEIGRRAFKILSQKKIPDTGKNKREESYPKYTTEQLQQIFSCPVFDVGKPLERATRARALQSSDFWMPLLSLFTGARGQELAQLYSTDVAQVDGIWCISIDDSEADKKTKGRLGQSNRLVPIHQQLITIGFIDFCEEKVKESEKHLFPELRAHATGKANPYKKWGDWYSRMILDKYVDFGEGRKPVFHSFRDTFISELKDNGVSRENRTQIVGHSKGTAAHERYAKDLPPKLLVAEVNKAQYSDLDISKVSWQRFKDKALG